MTVATTTAVAPFVARHLTKRFDERVALANLTFEVPEGRIVGLLGRNGAGKTTLLNLISGLLLPTSGTAETLGVATVDLDAPQITRLGVVQQEGQLLPWMTVRQHLDLNASFYPSWDHDLERRLLAELEVDPKRRIIELSTGDRQKAGILLGVCHRPGFLLLDEPMSALDPIVRARMLDLLVERLREDGCTVLISSHILNDVEKIIDWVLCLHEGALVENAAFDDVQESYAEWTIASPTGSLPARFSDPFVLSQQGDARQAIVRVRAGAAEVDAFAIRYGAEVRTRRLSLDEMFPLFALNRESRQ